MKSLREADPRCIECGRTKDLHIGNSLFCPGLMGKVMETTYKTMALPEGRTCQDCYHFRLFCQPVIGYKGTETSCDFFPVRFLSIARMRKLLDKMEVPEVGH
jgi:hypothetical protein